MRIKIFPTSKSQKGNSCLFEMNFICKGLILAILIVNCNKSNDSSIKDLTVAALTDNSSLIKKQSTSEPISKTPVDTNSGKSSDLPATFSGNTDFQASFVGSSQAFDRFSNIRIKFSKSVNKNSIVYGSNAQVLTSTNTLVSGRLLWDSQFDLLFDPDKELQSVQNYTIILNSSIKSDTGLSLTPFTVIFTTEGAFQLTTFINGYKSGNSANIIDNPDKAGIIIDKTASPGVTLSTTITNPQLIQSLKLCLLGKTSGGDLVCKSDVAVGIELCPSSPCKSITYSVNLNQTSIPPIEGTNNYYYEITSVNGKKYYRSVNFNYGYTASDKNGLMYRTATAILDNVSSLPILSQLIAKYARGEFSLNASGKNASFTSSSNTITVNDATGLHTGMYVTSRYLPAGTRVTGIAGTTITLSQNATATVSMPATNNVYFGGTLLDTILYPEDMNASELPGIVSVHPSQYSVVSKRKANCIEWKKADNSTFTIKHLTKVGPFCGITVSGSIFDHPVYQSVKYTAVADAYVTDIQIDNTANPGNLNNIEINLKPHSDNSVEIELFGKKARGKLALVARVQSIEFFDYLVNDTFVYMDDTYTVNGQNKKEGDAISFAMNEDPPSTSIRKAIASANLSVPNTDGLLSILVTPSVYDSSYTNIISPYNFNRSNPITEEWGNSIITNPLTGVGTIASLIADVVNQKIPEVKGQIVQGVVKNIAENVAPVIINNILGQLKSGITMNLPDYLPRPLSKLKVNLIASLHQNGFFAKESDSKSGLEAEADASVGATVCIYDGTGKCQWEAGYNSSTAVVLPKPPTPLGVDSFLVLKKQNSGLPTQFARMKDSDYSGGLLLTLHTDAINQAVYQLWKAGGLNFIIDKDFIESVNKISGTNGLLSLTDSLLQAEPILTVLSPGQTFLTAVDNSGNTVQIDQYDDIEMIVNPLLMPVISPSKPTGAIGSLVLPKIEANLSDLVVEIKGKKCAVARVLGTINGKSGKMICPGNNYDLTKTYTLSKVRVSLKTKAEMSFGTYTNPDTVNYPSMSSFNGRTSIRLKISDDLNDLYYLVEPGESASDNPLNLNPKAIWEVFDPLIKTLVIPLVNNVVKEIPLPDLKACGLELKNLQIMKIKVMQAEEEPFVFLNTSLSSYPYVGENCKF